MAFIEPSSRIFICKSHDHVCRYTSLLIRAALKNNALEDRFFFISKKAINKDMCSSSILMLTYGLPVFDGLGISVYDAFAFNGNK